MNDRNWNNGTGSQRRTQIGPPAPQACAGSLEMVQANTGAFRDLAKLNSALAAMASVANVVTPAVMVASIPDGCSAVLTMARIDVNNGGDVYKVAGKVALTKAAIERIAAGAGVKIVESARKDDRSDPHYCEWTAVAVVPDMFGREIPMPGSVALDLRDGSAEAQGMGAGLRDARKWILRQAESKAILRAIRRSLQIRSAYTAEEAVRPFVAMQVVFDGSFEDPEMRREYARARIAQATGAANLLTGFRPAPAPEPVVVHDEGHDHDFEEAEEVEQPGADESQAGPLDAEGWPEGHPLSTGRLLALAKAKGRTAQQLADLAQWLVRNKAPERRQPFYDGIVGLPDAGDEDPAPF